MGKKKKNSRNESSNVVDKISNAIEKQGLTTETEIIDFMGALVGKSVDDIPDFANEQDEVLNMVFDAYEVSIAKGKQMIKKALKLDPNSVDAYVYLADIETKTEKAIALYKKAIELGEKVLGKEFFEETRGHFWGFMETRPYMRAKAGLGLRYHAEARIDDAIVVYEEMLELNQNDNQGIRYLLTTALLEQNYFEKYLSLYEEYSGDPSASWRYNFALYHFKKEGNSVRSKEALQDAFESNEYVMNYMLGFKKMPKNPPDYIGMGDKNEAIAYVFDAGALWDGTEGAFEWLYAFKRIKEKQ